MLLLSLLVAAAQPDVDYERGVLPILEQRCFEGHQGGGKKPKAGLRLDGADWIRKGAKSGPVLVAGDAKSSSLFERIALPADDIDIMPPNGEPLESSQIDLIRRWIDEGADFGSWKGAGGPAEPVRTVEPRKVPSRVRTWSELAKGVDPLPASSVSKELRELSQIEPVIPGSPLLRVSFLAHQDSVDNRRLKALSSLATHVSYLDLGRTAITNDGMKSLSRMKRLTHLDLRSTSISDAGVQRVSSLPELRSLNLYDTEVSDDSMTAIAKLPKLETVYLFGSKVTAKGVSELQRARPKLRVQWRRDFPDPLPVPVDED